jgi:hypothetical protein
MLTKRPERSLFEYQSKRPRDRGAFVFSPNAYLVLLMPALLFVMVPPWSEPGPEPP